jgi:hypothetical protein
MKQSSVFLKSCTFIVLVLLWSCQKKDIPPVINDQTFSVNENSTVGTVVGKVIASDEDGSVVSYSIKSGNTNNAFSISETDGTISVNNKSEIDFETTPSFDLLIEIKDNKNKSSIANIIINLNDIQIPITNQTFSINEYSSIGSLVGQILVANHTVTYSIISGNADSAFNISGLNGKITVHNDEVLDYDTKPSFTLVVEAKDADNEKASANITINLNKVEIPTSGLELYMPFEGNTNDLSGNSNNGIDYTSKKYVPGKRSQGLDFDGTSDYIQLKNTIESKNGLSFSFWVNTRGANGSENNGSIVSKYNMTTNTRCFMVWSFGANETRNDNRLGVAFYEYGYSSAYHDMTKSYLEAADLVSYSNPALWIITNPTRLIPNEWTHCLVNLTSTAVETWIDGELCTKKLRKYTTYNSSASEPILIGNNYAIGDGSNNHFNGILDELRIYNRALTKAEIKALFKR